MSKDDQIFDVELIHIMLHDSFSVFDELTILQSITPDQLRAALTKSKKIAISYLTHFSEVQKSNNYKFATIGEIITVLKSEFTKVNIKCQNELLDLKVDIPQIICFALVKNLISNSIIHGGKEYQDIDIQVELKSNDKDNTIHLIYSDNGKGISAVNQENLFKLKQGLLLKNGIGLSTIRRLLMNYGGDIKLDGGQLETGYFIPKFHCLLPIHNG
ncbi:MAG: ATP-binding protein [Saprospiraceae bacterium]